MSDFECYGSKKAKSGSKAKARSADSENRDGDSDDFPSMLGDLCVNINWKIAFILFIIGIFIFSDVFIELLLVRIKGAVEGDVTTTKGTVIQLAIYSVAYIVIDLLVAGGVV